jgi:hypothetical protein
MNQRLISQQRVEVAPRHGPRGNSYHVTFSRLTRASQRAAGTVPDRPLGGPSPLADHVAARVLLDVGGRGADLAQRGPAVSLHGEITERHDTDDAAAILDDRHAADGLGTHHLHHLPRAG